MNRDCLQTLDRISLSSGEAQIYRLENLEKQNLANVQHLPRSIKILLEAALRLNDGFRIRDEDVLRIASWSPDNTAPVEIPFRPSRVILQDFTGVPSVVDLAALRSAMSRLGGDPSRVNPGVPVDLVIDHSVQVDHFGSPEALQLNSDLEFKRNRERYEFLRWGTRSFDNFRVVPPATGIVHQVNLEFLAEVVRQDPGEGLPLLYPDSLVGTDSHTTMINGLGVLGWGVGGIEAEAVMLGEPISMLLPAVVGMRLQGQLPEGRTATDLVLTVTEKLREHGVVGKFVEYCGPGYAALSLADRATLANMGPEYGATVGFCPVDDMTLDYLRLSGRSEELIDRVERYSREQGLFASGEEPQFSETLELDLSTVEASLAGPARPQDRISLTDMPSGFRKLLDERYPEQAEQLRNDAGEKQLGNASVVIAAITSCTNTSNPGVLIAAGLLARNAVEKGLRVPDWVKTSLAPGSRVVSSYLDKAGLSSSLEKLKFHTVGYGCAVCIGNSGPLPEEVRREVEQKDLVVAGVLSGNRNFEGRVSPHTRANYLASPPLVVAYALAGRVDIDFETEAIADGVFLRDIWPSNDEVRNLMESSLGSEQFREAYRDVFDSNETWNAIEVPEGQLFEWDEDSSYIREPSFFLHLQPEPSSIEAVQSARCLLMLGDSVTTDHISPAGVIAKDSPAATYLRDMGVEDRDFNSYGSRRGNHEVMMRGTFANIRIRNEILDGVEGGYSLHIPSGEQMSVWEVAERYREEKTPLVVLAGKQYGTGSSRDWAAKGTSLQGIRAVIAESFERIHRSNLAGFGVLPLQFQEGDSHRSLGLTGRELFDIEGLHDSLKPGEKLRVSARSEDGSEKQFEVVLRLDTPVEIDYYRHGGILHSVLRRMASD
ncbi:MAG: aconitate hydratase AcnA [Candidatus Krumholzibacteria bacterium]|jgi:aconitate hydratase|nr:aconitate hydratase AcnA [Candidatus Krumholzibacteria bacterium]MDP6797660.1 aconitate hydratase AcnA [Candidatus Krumholzibacteria bacterium]MDP7022567.1 aconitate hydratase AcnA [Candidatus Krumholzibacteria bacterium]